MSPKVIPYYVKHVYGNRQEYVAPSHAGDAAILSRLTGRKTLDSITRELVRDLTGGQVTFEQVLPPVGS